MRTFRRVRYNVPLPAWERRRRQRAFLAAWVRARNFRRAGARSGVDHQRHFDWLRKDPAYRAAFRRARMAIAEAAERAIYRRARLTRPSDADLMDVVRRLKRAGYASGSAGAGGPLPIQSRGPKIKSWRRMRASGLCSAGSAAIVSRSSSARTARSAER